ncbi:putative radical SAM superfamily protein [Desulfosporosinus sp. I2]|uniref:radical SAM protein n=1 Tax=Desulfosporosinus sp. I2 TaxID=1617025 RepID=UPI0005ED8080|nr:radical SAM protein [Desulfosporosinus sp. I2]KJR48233.1 putative radical SAM superfamily protein [Desulfosporosinus sp. I2]
MESGELETKVLIRCAWEARKKHFADEIWFDFPSLTESITLTGQACALNCAHCGGHYLKGMRSVSEIKIDGSLDSNLTFRSALVSGGCTFEGKVPFEEHLEFLYNLKQSVRLNFHVGLLDGKEISLLKGLADVVSFDFVADRETIQEVYGLKQGPEDYRRVYLGLQEVVPVIPHLTLGLRGGEWGGEERALDALQELGFTGLVFNVFIPTPGTRYALRQPLPVEEVVRFLAKARLRFPDVPLALGCMRPKGKYRQILDEAAVSLGLNRLVMPTPRARRRAEELGLRVIKGEECCAL